MLAASTRKVVQLGLSMKRAQGQQGEVRRLPAWLLVICILSSGEVAQASN